MNNKIVRTISFFLIVLLLLPGCVRPGGPTEPGQTMEPGKPSSDSSSHPGKDDSESVIRTLADQQSEWTEGQYYPGAYGKTSSTFRFPANTSIYTVFEADGIVYASGDPFNAENTGRMHVIRKTDGTKEEDIFLTEIPDEYRLYQMYGTADTVYLLAYQYETIADTQHLELFIYSTAGEFRTRKKLTEPRSRRLLRILLGGERGFTRAHLDDARVPHLDSDTALDTLLRKVVVER